MKLYNSVRELLQENPNVSLEPLKKTTFKWQYLKKGDCISLSHYDIDEGTTVWAIKIDNFTVKQYGIRKYIIVNGLWCYVETTKLDKLNNLKTGNVFKGHDFLEGEIWLLPYDLEQELFENKQVSNLHEVINSNDKEEIIDIFNDEIMSKSYTHDCKLWNAMW